MIHSKLIPISLFICRLFLEINASVCFIKTNLFTKLRPVFAILPSILFFISMLTCSQALAISEYGLRCDDNKACVKCRKDIDCIKCMHRCWNAYGYADSDIKNASGRSNEEICQLKRAKWCNAQCWDPDDVKKPDYVSTKPICNDKSYYFPEGGIKFPENRPDY